MQCLDGRELRNLVRPEDSGWTNDFVSDEAAQGMRLALSVILQKVELQHGSL